ncbi:BLUF domain-containing protein [Tamlana crocina]
MIKTVCYLSDSVEHNTMDELKTLYEKAKENNRANNITGVLIYKDRNFLQVLEGEEHHVDQTFKRIEKDKRHKNIFEIINSEIEERIFEDYNFGFTIVNNSEELKNLYQYLDWLKEADSSHVNKVVKMVENFVSSK